MPFPKKYLETAQKCVDEGRANMTKEIEKHLKLKDDEIEADYAFKKHDAEYALRKDALTAEKKKLEQQADAMMEETLKSAIAQVASEQ
jgi:hypothetical protein